LHGPIRFPDGIWSTTTIADGIDLRRGLI